MSSLKDIVSNRVVSPNIDSSINTKSYGIVIKAYESENVCDITYFDAKNIQRNRNKVEVRLNSRTENWFPKNGEMVYVEVYEENVIITGEVVTDFNTQVKTKQIAKNDIYVDGADCSVGGYIF